MKHFHNISSCFSSALDKFNLNRGASILVALSGGPDSTALIALINRERRRRDIYLAAAHFNHKLRPEADEEERAVQTLCEKLSIPLEIGIGRVEEYSRRTGKSIHTAARDLRHHFLAAAARSWAASNQSPEPIIALGHHEDDGLETMLMRLFGGSGVEGLAWMAPDARSPADSGVRLVRPVLGFTREELRRFCECEGLEFADDQTNEDVKYPRNRVRRELIPQIERLFGSSARRGLRRSGELLAEAASLFGIMSDEAYEKCMVEEKVGEVILDYLAFSSYNTLIQSDMLQRGARVAAGGSARISLERCRAALQTAAKSARLTQMGEGVCAQRWRNALYIYHNPSDWKARVLDIDSRIEIRGFGVISLELLDAGSVQIPPPPGILYLDAAYFETSSALLRPVRAGDAMRPLGADYACRVRDLLRDARVPPHRRGYPVIEIGGCIAALPPLRIAEQFKLTHSSKRAMKITFEPILAHTQTELQEFYDRPESLWQRA